MLTVTACIGIVALAIINAAFSQPPDDFLFPKDEELYVPPFLSSEGFYRSCLINVSFASISISVFANSGNSNQSIYWSIFSPGLAVILNLIFGFAASISLKANPSPPTAGKRRQMVVINLVICVILFLYSVLAAAKPPNV